MKQKNIPRILFFFLCFISLVGGSFLLGAYRVFPYSILKNVRDSVLLVISERPVLTGARPIHHLQPARGPGDGVTVNLVPSGEDDLVFVASFFDGNPGLRLIRRDGEVVNQWEASYTKLFPNPDFLPFPPAGDWNADIHGALALPDGSVLFNFEYAGLVRLDRCGAPLWTVRRPAHHSVELAAGGGFWVPGRRFYEAGDPTPFPPFQTPFEEDTLLRISDTGEVLAEISAPEIFYLNELEALLTSNGHGMESGVDWDEEIVHLNKIAELSAELADRFEMFEAGDLLLSFRTLNLLMVIDPETRAVKWQQTGPWLRQHDPQFAPDGRIVLFNNNIYANSAPEYRGPDLTIDKIPRPANIMAVDPATGQVEVLYGGAGQELLSVIRGKVSPLAGGGLLITEFEGGRVLQTDATGKVVWEYINRYDETDVVEITSARVYPQEYFTVTDWSCPARPGGG